MNEKVISLYGQLTGERQVLENAVSAMADWSEKVKAGEVVGVVVIGVYADGCSGYTCSGLLGRYNTLGAMDMAHREVIDLIRASDK